LLVRGSMQVQIFFLKKEDGMHHFLSERLVYTNSYAEDFYSLILSCTAAIQSRECMFKL
jgi:hypothetical protein